MEKKQLSSHQFAEVYKGLGLNLSTLGCVMLDLEPPIDLLTMEDEIKNTGCFYYAKDKSRFWIDGFVGKNPHVTLLYGLIEQAKNYEWHIEQVLKGWKLEDVEVEKIGYFDSPYPDEPYYCIVAHVKITPELLEGHQRLEFLPHINTFTGYKAHFTIAYVRKEDKHQTLDWHLQAYSFLVGKKLKVAEPLNLGGNK